jgi:1-acyl-sn-glycerol-3-phosphate acyltransferase
MPDIKPQVYKDPRPPEYFARFHEYVREHPPGWIYELVRLITSWISIFLYRERAIGTSNVPANGPAVVAPNHFSNMDHFFAGVYLRRKMQFMAKSQLFGNPILNYIFRIGGVFPVRRGHHDEEAFKTAHAVLARGNCVLMYCEGGRSRTGELGEAKPGVGRIALESGVPIVPCAIHGSLGVRKWRKLVFPKVTVQYGEPITFPVVENATREQQLEAAERVFASVKEMYGELQQHGRAGVLKSRKQAPISVQGSGSGV